MTDLATQSPVAGGQPGEAVSPHEVRRALRDGAEIALLDVRPEGLHARGHPLFAASLPLDRMELTLLDRLPRMETRIVVMGADATESEAAAVRLRGLGYADVTVLDGGIEGWTASGGELFADVNAPSKAFGELVAETVGTPSIAPEELRGLLDAGADVVVLDARRWDEYRTMSVPGATSVPGAGLVGHVAGLDDAGDRLVVVNCAGRTRSIIGTQSLVNAGVAPRVAALRNGTIGWTLAGLPLEHGREQRGAETGGPAGRRAASAARAVADRAGVGRLSAAGLDDLLGGDRTVYQFDVRSPEAFARSHRVGFTSAPGGQLVQETDRYAPVRGAVIVLTDDDGSEASMTGSWLAQMGWTVHVLDGVRAGDGTGSGPGSRRLPPLPTIDWRTPGEAADGLAAGTVQLLDVDLSARYLAGHIPGAVWARRSRLAGADGGAPGWVRPPAEVLVTSHDDALTALTVAELGSRLAVSAGRQQGHGPEVRGLRGGTDGWMQSGRILETGPAAAAPALAPEPASGALDVYRRPYEGIDVDPAAMQAYLDWEYGLVAQLARDGTHNFAVLTAPAFP